MPTLDRVLEFRQQMFDHSRDLVAQKGHDYNHQQQYDGDTLFNLKVCELMGITKTAEEGILVRLSDKFMRLISLTRPGVAAEVKEETVLDTILDIHNYVDYLGLMWWERHHDEDNQVAEEETPA
jgi:hypothetical protein